MRNVAWLGFVVGAASLPGCSGWFEPTPTEGVAGIDELEGTRLESGLAPVATFAFDSASSAAGPFGAAGGVQVQRVFPGEGPADPLQVVAIFDRAMVPLTDLDTMSGSVPITCVPDIGFQRRWAGTTTALLVAPRGGLPAATQFDCSIADQVVAVDGTKFQGPANWSFQTPTLTFELVDPQPDADHVDPQEPVRVHFSEAVSAASVPELLSLRSESGPVDFVATVDEHDPQLFTLDVSLVADEGYTLTLPAGSVGVEGPLRTPTAQRVNFRTYPPLTVLAVSPEDSTSADVWLEIEFTNEVSAEEVKKHLTIDPIPPGWEPPDQSWASTRWSYGVSLAPQTTYRVTLSAGVEDSWHQTLGSDRSWSFTTGDRDPSWAVPYGLSLYPANNPKSLPFRRMNLDDVEVRSRSVDPAEAVNTYADLPVPGPASRVAPGAPRNRSQLELVDLAPHLSSDGFGWVANEFSSSVLAQEGGAGTVTNVVVVTDLGATVKLEPDATLVFVTSLATGEPVADVEVEIRAGTRDERTGRDVPGQPISLGKTGADGVLQFEGAPDEAWNRWSGPFAIHLRKGNDRSVVFADWTPTWSSFENDGVELRPFAFADRGLYRLGDPVFGHASFRTADRHGLAAVAGAAVWTLSDPSGAGVATGTGTLSPDGWLDVETKLPSSGALGDWTLAVTATVGVRSNTAYITVPVKAYRPAAFRVEASGPPSAIAGDTVTMNVDARYLFGAPMNQASVVFRGYASREDFAPDGFEAWSFGPETRWWDDEPDAERPMRIPNARPPLVGGAATFDVPLTDPGWQSRAWRLDLEASVTDVDRQQLSANHHLTVLPAAYGVGVRPTSYVSTVGEASTVELVTVAGDGTVVTGRSVEVSVVKRSFDSVRERGMDGRWRYVTTTTDTAVTSGSVRTASGPVRFSFEPAEAGMHVFIARSTDDAGRTFTSEASTYVAGADASWARADGRAWLVADKKEYAPGDTAKVVVKGHVPGSHALVTVEREGVLWKQTLELMGSSPVVEIPISADWVPGVQVSVAAVTGAGPQDAPDKGRPELVFGLIDLAVASSDRHLQVDVTPAGTTFAPRDEVTVSVAVERNGAPAPGATVTLFAVDEGVLSLTGYATPDPFETMYRAHARNVVTLDNRQAILDRAEFLTKGANPGGGGGGLPGSGPEIRSKFLTTITWQSLRTGPDGSVKATFQLPDNLTEFRVMAVAEQADAFGADDERIRVSRPLVLRPALPRALREGDQTFAGVVVHNHTDTAHSVTVTAAATGPVRLEGSPAVVSVPAEGSVEVPFRVFADEVGQVEFTFQGEMDGNMDGVVTSLPIRRDVSLESVGTAGLVDGTWSERLVMPDGVRPQVGGLGVTFGTTVLAGTDDALGYLLEYPHGCVEQVTSRGMGALAVLAVRERSGSTYSEQDLRGTVTAVLEQLPRFQSWGGYAYWPGDEPSYEGSRYALEFLARASAAGFPVEREGMKRTAQWMRQVETSWEFEQLSADEQRRLRAEIAIALAGAGEADSGLLSRVYGERDQLSLQLQAELLTALLQASGKSERTSALAASLTARSYVEAAGASLREPRVGWGSDDRATAAALAAFVALGDQPLVPKYAMFLAQSRRAGRWHDTRATAAALLALADYAAKYETQSGSVDATLSLAGKELYHQALKVPGSARVDVAMADLSTGGLDLAGDRLYWSTRLTYAPLVARPREEGFWIDRRLELVEGGGPNGELVAGATVRVTLTVATPVERFEVAVRDPFPAGLEAVDSSLATTSMAQRQMLADQGDEVGSSGAEWGGDSFDHHELDDSEVRLFARSLSPGIHTYRYLLRATAPGQYAHPPARVEEMYEPENFGSTAGGKIVVGR